MLRAISQLSKVIGPFLLSTALHLGAAAGLLYIAPKIIEDKDTILEFSLAKPPEASKPEPKPLPPPPPKPKPKPEPKPEAKEEPPVPAPNQEPPPETNKNEPPKPIFGLTMASVVTGDGAGNGIAFAVGNTLMKEPEKKATPLEDVKPLTYMAPKKEFKPVAAHQITEMPETIEVVKFPYPPEEMKKGVQGTVILQVAIEDTGEVLWVKVIKSVSPVLDELAKKALMQSKFKPAKKDGKPVAYIITFKYNWEIVE